MGNKLNGATKLAVIMQFLKEAGERCYSTAKFYDLPTAASSRISKNIEEVVHVLAIAD